MRCRLDDQPGDAVFHELERTAGVGGGHNRFVRQERFQGDVAVIFVKWRKHHAQRIRVQLHQVRSVHIARERHAIRDVCSHGGLSQFVAQRAFADHEQSGCAVGIGKRADDQVHTLVGFEPAHGKHVVAAGTGAQPSGEWRRMVERLRRDAVEARQPRRGIAAVREQPDRFTEHFVVEGDEPVAEPDVRFVVGEFAVRRADQVVDGAVLVKQPRHLVRMPDEVGGKFGRNHRIDPLSVGLGEIHEPPGGRLGEELLLRIPLEGNRGRLRLVPLAPQFVHETLDVQLGTAAHEWHLCFADENPALHLAL